MSRRMSSEDDTPATGGRGGSDRNGDCRNNEGPKDRHGRCALAYSPPQRKDGSGYSDKDRVRASEDGAGSAGSTQKWGSEGEHTQSLGPWLRGVASRSSLGVVAFEGGQGERLGTVMRG
ncbi:UNVERIFIED_CONTAM: hypothetical protein K2H54_043545 [Gekko kuhli]